MKKLPCRFFNFPNGNLKQQLSHIGVFICYQIIDAKNELNLHICGMHFLNPYKPLVSHLKLPIEVLHGSHVGWQEQ